MILDQISWLDCFVFLVFLAPQLVLHVGVLKTATWLIGALPFLSMSNLLINQHLVNDLISVPPAIQLPFQFIHERYFTPKERQSPFVRRATPFQDFVIRCVRYAFANMPAFIGRVFFSKDVALPLLRFRMLRNGYFQSPLPWREVSMPHLKGIWIVPDNSQKPDVVVYYCHGGGFSMGSSYFYMEFLLAWVTLLREAGFQNPALFALEYSLVPDAVYPTQVRETFVGYTYVLSIIEDASRVCVAGDSAGATLILSMLLALAEHSEYGERLPGLAVMISPWVTIISDKNRNTRSDYLDQKSLHLYGSQYIDTKVSPHDPLVSPGECQDLDRWKRASPTGGWFFLYGSEEVLAPECRDLVERLRKTGPDVDVHEEQGSIHAWPVAALYLGETKEARLHGLRDIVKTIKKRLVLPGKEYEGLLNARTKKR